MKGIFESKDLSIVAKQVDGFRGFVPMFHPHMEIVCVLTGGIRMNIDGISQTLMPGQLSLCFPYVIHSYEEAPETKAIILLFSPESTGVFARTLIQIKPKNPFIQATEETVRLLLQIVEHRRTQGPFHEMTANAYLSALIGQLLTTVPMEETGSMDAETVQNLLVYCTEHYREAISIKSTAQGLHISESYVSKLFSEKLGCPFRTYINRLRIMDVKKLLKNTNRTIIDIMLECGFRNQSSFNRIFTQETGCTPSEYRQGKS